MEREFLPWLVATEQGATENQELRSRPLKKKEKAKKEVIQIDTQNHCSKTKE